MICRWMSRFGWIRDTSRVFLSHSVGDQGNEFGNLHKNFLMKKEKLAMRHFQSIRLIYNLRPNGEYVKELRQTIETRRTN